MLRLLLIGIASLVACFPIFWLATWATGSNDVGGWSALTLAFVGVPVLLLRIWRAPFSGAKCPDGKGLYPECLYIVTASETEITSTCPNGIVHCIQRSELKEVAIVTTDSGPWAADVWWHFTCAKGELAFPGGSTGEAKIIEWVHRLPSFNSEQLIKAMGSTTNARFVCWQAERA